jgi:hypothetical protein
MDTRDIPREQWIRFFDDFSKQHEGWIVTLEEISPELGDQEVAAGLPLIGISADLKDGENRIEIIAGAEPEAHVTRIIEKPKRVWLKESQEVAHEAIEIESEDGTATLLRFWHVHPEQTDRQLPASA